MLWKTYENAKTQTLMKRLHLLKPYLIFVMLTIRFWGITIHIRLIGDIGMGLNCGVPPNR